MKNINSLYIHFPYCTATCNYCDFFKMKKTNFFEEDLKKFHIYLQKSFEQINHELISRNSSIGHLETIFIGGGSPSLWGDLGPKFLKDFFNKNNLKFNNDSTFEFTIEVSPHSFTEENYHVWKDIGVNRFSIGVQSFNDVYLKKIGRIHSTNDVKKILEFLQKDSANYSVDLMIGLPSSDERDIAKELRELLKFSPSHLSVYILTPKDDYPLLNELPSDDFIANEFLLVSKMLREQGYTHYEISNFAKENMESKHNLAYWKSRSVLALGPSATGVLFSSSHNFLWRYKWNELLSDFAYSDFSYEEEKIDGESFFLEKFFMRLRTNLGITIEDYFQDDSIEKLKKLLNELKNENLIEVLPNNQFRLSINGYLLMDSIIDRIFQQKIFFKCH